MPEVIHIDYDVMPWYYNLSYSVGKNATNQRIDVMLVQYLLKKVFTTPLSAPAKPLVDIVVDGMYGPITASYISAYQQRDKIVNPDTCVMRDGRVDKARSADGMSGSMSGRLYTITCLNHSLQHHFSQIFVDPASATDMPGALKVCMCQIADAEEVNPMAA